MRTLRECSKSNKIKTRHNIAMVYKTRKTNKRRYLKGSQKRQTSKRYRKMYGGASPAYNNVNNNSATKDDIAANEIMEKIEEQNKVEFPSIDEIPIVGPVLEKTGDLIEGASVNLIDKTGDLLGIDVNNPGSVSQKLDDIKDMMSNPENVEKMKDIAGEMGKYGEVAVVAFKPAAEKFVDTSLPVVTEGIDKAVKAGVATGVNLVEDVAGPFIGIPRTILSAATAFNASVNAGSELVKGAAEAIQGTQENFERLLDESMPTMPTVSTMSKQNMLNSTMSKKYMPTVPTMDKQNMLNSTMSKKYMPTVSTMSKQYMPNQLTTEGGSIKKLHQSAIMIGGRAKKAQLEFLSPYVNKAQIITQYGGTKRKQMKHKKHNQTKRYK